jgi:5-formyltetrahydrofolate cyclo-ligase
MAAVDDPDLASAKAELREELLAARRARPAEELEAARSAIRDVVLSRVARPRAGVSCVAAYVPLRTEPGSVELLDALDRRGVRVLVPHTEPDRDLGWTQWSPGGVGPLLGRDAIADAALVLVPALAVARDGTRLGRGGGSYDRALRRAAPAVPVAALVFADEVLPELPRGPLDVPVTAAVTPQGWRALGGNADFPPPR